MDKMKYLESAIIVRIAFIRGIRPIQKHLYKITVITA